MADEQTEIEKHKQENRRLYDEFHNDVNTRTLSNIENHDKAILSLSTAVLGVSLAFIKDIVPIDKLININTLQLSWAVLILAIISVMISFWTGNLANNKHLEYAEDYYLKDNDKAFDNKSKWFTATEILNYASGILFIIGIILTAYFVNSNISKKEDNMIVQSTEKGVPPSKIKPKHKQFTEENIMSDKRIEKGAQPPKIKPKSDQSK